MEKIEKRGRKALDMAETTVRFPAEILAKIDEITGQKRRASFIREAVTEKLERMTGKAEGEK